MANHRITTTAVRSIHKSTVGEDFFLSRVLGLRACSSSSSNKPKNNVNDRLSGVIDAVNDRKLPPELRGQRNAVRSETDIINVVEQRIWHSMEEGQFENLPGKGKPLDLSSNPHADPADDTLYRILSKNKCLPEWVELNKEITNGIVGWRAALKNAWTCKQENEPNWIERSEVLKQRLRDINNKLNIKCIDLVCVDVWNVITVMANETMKLQPALHQVFRYNLIVPFGRQMNGLNWEKELVNLPGEPAK